jgi:tRNA(Ile)-lysidine synthase TilS/MesJ
MQVISLINGSLISENSTIYALHYAKFLGYKLTLIHINNGKDDIKEVKKSAEELMNLAKKFEVERLNKDASPNANESINKLIVKPIPVRTLTP